MNIHTYGITAQSGSSQSTILSPHSTCTKDTFMQIFCSCAITGERESREKSVRAEKLFIVIVYYYHYVI